MDDPNQYKEDKQRLVGLLMDYHNDLGGRGSYRYNTPFGSLELWWGGMWEWAWVEPSSELPIEVERAFQKGRRKP